MGKIETSRAQALAVLLVLAFAGRVPGQEAPPAAPGEAAGELKAGEVEAGEQPEPPVADQKQEAPSPEPKAGAKDALPESGAARFGPVDPILPTAEELSLSQADETLVIVGSNPSKGRTAIGSPVAVDVIPMDEVTARMGEVELNQLLSIVAPSFNANRQSGADGADHTDPATLRGLGPDQTLVLINGKRRHPSSLITIFGSRGRGNTGTDLDAIPLSAIERIEILRDGASALYGSDAIAGVINIVLKKDVEKLAAQVGVGAHNASPPGHYKVKRRDGLDGESVEASGNYGLRVGERGFVNLSASIQSEQKTNRAVDPAAFDIYRREFGDGSLDGFGAFVNAEVPILEGSRFYTFLGLSQRRSDAYAFTREADSERNVAEIYPDGFDPRIDAVVSDRSVCAGVKATFLQWELDASNTYGENRFHYFVENTVNASLLERSPTRFDAGGHELSENTTGLSLKREFSVLGSTYLSLGAEYRLERYRIEAGEEASYKNYGLTFQLQDGQAAWIDTLGRPGGAQGFPGYRPENEVDELRTNTGAYLNVDFDFTSYLMASTAVRYETYSDFGDTLTAKLASRLELAELLGTPLLDDLALRASVSTGFRAPSLAQRFYNSIYTDYVSGVAVDKIIAKNESPITRALGIPKLREETSLSFGAGLTARAGDLIASVDGYAIQIDDRIVLTGSFGGDDPEVGSELTALGVGAAQFFTNAINTQTYGLDIVLSYRKELGAHTLGTTFCGNLNWMELGKVKTSALLAGKEDIYFGRREQKFLLASAPSSKLSLAISYGWRFLRGDLRVMRYGEVVLADWNDEDDVYHPAYTVDLSLGADLTERLALVIGADNLLNAYPTEQDTNTDSGGLWDAVQMGFAGAFYFARLVARID